MSAPIQILSLNGLQPQGLYEGINLTFSWVNYFIGKNGSGKTQAMSRLHSQIQNYTNQNTASGYLGKFLPTNRTHSISGNREMLGGKMEQWETSNPTADAFYQFLNESEFTKSMVQSKLNQFFDKTIRIAPQGRNIVMDIFEQWLKKEKSDESSEADRTKRELKQLNLSNESDGMKEMLILLTYIYHPRVRVLGVDEAELHLHPQMINFVLDAIEEAAQMKQKQFFIVTHSPIAIRILPTSSWKYFFFDKKNNKVLDFDKFSDPNFSDLIPQLNPFRREVFYCDRVILVEGEQDYQILHNLSKKIGYSETDAGGFAFFPSWGGYEFERLYNFFNALNKTIFVIADSNIESLTKAGYSDSFKTVLNDSSITSKLSVDDIVLLCKEKDVLYPSKTSFGDNEKREIVRAEIKRINSNTFAESDYTELVGIIKKVLGDRSQFIIPEELLEMIKNLIATFQTRLSLKNYKELIKNGNIDEVRTQIKNDDKLTRYFQDADGDSFSIDLTSGTWKCSASFGHGKQKIKIEFDKSTDHSEYEPTVENIH